MLNHYVIKGDTVEICFEKRSDKIILIDLCDLKKVNSIKGRWHIYKTSLADLFYAIGSVNGKQTLLHRYILDARKGYDVDHFNHNGLDNRRCNIKEVNHELNMQNKLVRKDSASGVRGVTWDKHNNKWCAEIRTNGKRIYKKYFADLEEAKNNISEVREIYFSNTNENLLNVIQKPIIKEAPKAQEYRDLGDFGRRDAVLKLIRYIKEKEDCNFDDAYGHLKKILEA
jgi:hypothetical protein